MTAKYHKTMKIYIALLRGINVSGQKKIKMADLRKALQKLPFEDIETYIQSGNIVFKTAYTNVVEIEELIKKTILDSFGFDVPVLVKSSVELEEILQANPYTNPNDLAEKKIYYVLLKSAPKANAIPNLNQDDYPNELFDITSSCVYLNCKKGAGNAKLTNNIIEKKLAVSATTRNHRTMTKLLEITKA